MNYMPAAWSDPAAGVFFSARRRYGILGGAAACILWFTRGGFHAILMQTCGRSLSSVFSKTTKEGINMNYMICIPSPRLVSREYCERIPIGTPFSQMIENCGGLPEGDNKVLAGGPMMAPTQRPSCSQKSARIET